MESSVYHKKIKGILNAVNKALGGKDTDESIVRMILKIEMTRLTVCIVSFLLLLIVGCDDLNNERIQIRNYLLEDGVDSLIVSDTIKITDSAIAFKSGNMVLKKIFIWDSLIKAEGLSSQLTLHENSLRVTENLSADLKKLEISYGLQDGGSLAAAAYYINGVGIVYYQPWDSKSIFWLQNVVNVEGYNRDTINIQVSEMIVSTQPEYADTTMVSDELGEIVIEY